MKTTKIIIGAVILVLLGFYGYYNTLSYKIYKDIGKYERSDNKIAVKFSKKIIIEKYPYSIYYFIVKK